jgi:hypothetical protein
MFRKVMKHLSLIGLVIILSSGCLIAQTNCSEQLRQAERRFDEGLLDDIPQMIRPCMESGFTKEEKANAYKLLIQTYLFSDNRQSADEEMLKFLKAFPEYSIGAADTKEFIDLYRTYRTEPILRIEPYLGVNYSMPYVFEYYGLGDLNSSVPEYFSNLGITVGANYTDELYKGIDGSFGLSFHYSRVGYFYEVFDHTYIEGTYNELHIGLPLSVRYYFNVKSFEMFAKGGIETVYLLQSSNDLTRGYSQGGDNLVGTVDLTAYHKKIDVRPFVGVGFSPRFGNIKLLVDTGFRFGTIVPVDKDLRYTNNELREKYYMIEDKWIFNHFYFNISYVFSIYKPTKIR